MVKMYSPLKKGLGGCLNEMRDSFSVGSVVKALKINKLIGIFTQLGL
jgi:hypothetical protein